MLCATHTDSDALMRALCGCIRVCIIVNSCSVGELVHEHADGPVDTIAISADFLFLEK